MSTLLTQALEYLKEPYALIELCSMTCALVGSLLLALKGRLAAWGWVLFGLSNAGWIVFALGHRHWYFLAQQIGFSITSIIGIWSWLIVPALDSKTLRDQSQSKVSLT